MVGVGDADGVEYPLVTQNDEFVSLGLVPGGTFSRGLATSDDGVVVVGSCDEFPGSGSRAMRYSPASHMVSLGTLPPGGPGQNSVATDVSGDGSVVVGTSTIPGGGGHGFRWTGSISGMVDLGVPPGATSSFANATNQNGSVVVGRHQHAGLDVDQQPGDGGL